MDSVNMPEQRTPQTANEISSYLFIKCIITLVQTADVLMGKVEAPATGEPVMDLPRVQLIIKQLEMLDENAAKLGLEEQQMLKQSLQELRMAYVSAARKTWPGRTRRPRKLCPSQPPRRTMMTMRMTNRAARASLKNIRRRIYLR